jgi:hypothetical protein
VISAGDGVAAHCGVIYLRPDRPTRVFCPFCEDYSEQRQVGRAKKTESAENSRADSRLSFGFRITRRVGHPGAESLKL